MKKLIIDKNHAVMVLKRSPVLREYEAWSISIFDNNGISIMMLGEKDMEKIKKFLGDEEGLCITCKVNPWMNSFYKECRDCIEKHAEEKDEK